MIFKMKIHILKNYFSSTILTSDDVEYQPNPVHPGLFDVSITVDIDPFDVVQQDMISCEITIPDTEFSVRMETEIFEKPGEKDL